MRIVIGGASGFLGSALVDRLEARGDEVIRLVRRSPANWAEVQWDPAGGSVDAAALEGADAIVNLGGVGIGSRRWDGEHKRAVTDSRVQATGTLAEAVASLDSPPGIFVSASAIGYYGDRQDEALTEESRPGSADDFLVQVTELWEQAARPAVDAGVAVAYLRTGIVLGEGGALSSPVQILGPVSAHQLLLFKLGFGGRFGGGRQWWSWISLEDHVRATLHIIDHKMAGAFNLTAPKPVRQGDFAKSLAKHLGRPAVVPTPRFVIDAALGKDRAQALVFTSARVLPQALEASGFEFRHDTVDEALAASPGL